MSSASSAVTYTSVYTDSKPCRVFWGADEELSDGGSPRVIMYGYDGFPMLPVAPPSPDYIPGPEEPQTPPAPQDEDEHEPRFIQSHDPDFMPEPIYPEYIPLDDEHILPAEEQPLLPVVTPTTESPGYVTVSDPEEDPEEHEDEETEDGPVDYPMDGGDDGDDDDGDSSGDNANDEDEDEEDEEKEEHLAPTDSVVVIPTDELVSPPERIEPVIPPPSTDTATTRAKIIVRLQDATSFPPEMQQTKIAELRENDRKRQAQMAKTLRVMGDMRREMGDIQAELLALHGQSRRTRQLGGDARVLNHQDALRDADSHI
uniref:Reverse transcriptase domain-containing protein n=1 Tax=Tanacetum cinerariifolium TaxID=118510 RepID=A0A699KI47_TANCI|nr:hypothetical protein [Tanacetum cinerariifolium]